MVTFERNPKKGREGTTEMSVGREFLGRALRAEALRWRPAWCCQGSQDTGAGGDHLRENGRGSPSMVFLCKFRVSAGAQRGRLC